MLSPRHWTAGLIWLGVVCAHGLLLLLLGLLDFAPRVMQPSVEWVQSVEVVTEPPQPRVDRPRTTPPISRAQPSAQASASVMSTSNPPTTSQPVALTPSPSPALRSGAVMVDANAVAVTTGPAGPTVPPTGRGVNDDLTPPSQLAAYLNNPPPTYPAISKRLGEQGRVVIRVFIDERGQPREAQFESRSGYSRLDQAAMDAVMSWLYVPAKRGGVPQAMWFNVPITFDLKQQRD